MSVTAMIIQARLGSSRLPGKVLKPLAGRTILEHVLERAAAIEGVDVVCCAVPEGSVDDPVAAEAERLGFVVYRGSQDDVLDRYYQAAKMLNADIVMRATSDCPYLDPEVCAQVLALLKSEQADYATNNMPPSWPHGLDCEAMTFAWLERSAQESQKQFEREHVSQYVRNHPDARQVNVSCPQEGVHELRWTIDNPSDYDFFTEMAKRMPKGRDAWNWQVPLNIVRAEPKLCDINAGQDRLEGLKKSIAAEEA